MTTGIFIWVMCSQIKRCKSDGNKVNDQLDRPTVYVVRQGRLEYITGLSS